MPSNPRALLANTSGVLQPRMAWLLNERRKELNISMIELARIQGVDSSTVSRFFNGRRRSSSVRLVELYAALLNCHFEVTLVPNDPDYYEGS